MRRMLAVHDIIHVSAGSAIGVALCHLNNGEVAAPAVLLATGALLIFFAHRIVRLFAPKDLDL